MRAGVLASGAEASNGEQPDIPAQAEVFWTTAEGKEHHQTVDVAKRVPNIGSFAGTVWFKITDNGVEVIAANQNEDANAWLPLRHRAPGL